MAKTKKKGGKEIDEAT